MPNIASNALFNRIATNSSARIGLVILALFSLVGCLSDVESFSFDGVKREFIVHPPSGYDGTMSVPMVIALHPLASTGRQMKDVTQLDDVADREGFIAVFPEGTDKRWYLSGFLPSAPDDAGFISALIDYMLEMYNVDPSRVYVTGASNGALMAYEVACKFDDKVAAIAPVMGATMTEVTATACDASLPVSILAIHGTADTVLPWDGGLVQVGDLPAAEVFAVETAMAFWRDNNGCTSEAVVTELPDIDTSDGTTVSRTEYLDCTGNAAVVLYTIEGGGHSWPSGDPRADFKQIDAISRGDNRGNTSQDIVASDVIWEFFSQHVRE